MSNIQSRIRQSTGRTPVGVVYGAEDYKAMNKILHIGVARSIFFFFRVLTLSWHDCKAGVFSKQVVASLPNNGEGSDVLYADQKCAAPLSNDDPLAACGIASSLAI